MNKTKEAYQEFLETDFWKEISEKCKERDGNKCTRCPSRSRLEAHHVRYPEDWYETTLDDLVTLCRECHEKEHALIEIGGTGQVVIIQEVASTTNIPYLCISQKAISAIRENCENPQNLILIYFLLCEIAFNVGSFRFQIPEKLLAVRCGLEVARLKNFLNWFKEIGLIKITEGKRHFFAGSSPSIYEIVKL